MIKVFIIPYISVLSGKIDVALDPNNTSTTSSVEKIAAQNIRYSNIICLVLWKSNVVLKENHKKPKKLIVKKQEEREEKRKMVLKLHKN